MKKKLISVRKVQEMAFKIEESETIEIPLDWTWYLLCFFFATALLATAKIAYRWKTTYKVEHELHALLETPNVKSKKKSF